MATLQIRRNFQITLPVEVRKKVGCQVGDFIEAEVEDSQIVLTPKRIVDRLGKNVLARGPERSEGTPKQSQGRLGTGSTISKQSHNFLLEKKEVKQKRFNSLEEMMDRLDTKHTYILRVIDHE